VAFRWPNKDPDEILDYSVDWSRYLDSAIITNVSWFVDNADGVKTAIDPISVVNGIQNVGQTISNNRIATINIGLGDNNKEYKFYCRITDNTGSIAERSIKIRIKEY
jgi:hypothetical protein